jgi:cytochrome bd ubiquinol oxidase subunit II
MTLADLLIAVIFSGLTAYAVLGGADFGAGVLHLLSPTHLAGRRRQESITAAMGPAWEANHVWLIFVLTGLLTAFPDAFAALGSAVLAPASLALVAIVVRGGALAFAGQLTVSDRVERPVRLAFGLASAGAPLVMGALAGGLARQRVIVDGGHVLSGGGTALWLGWFQLATGLMALAACTAVAAVLLAARSSGRGEERLARGFRGHAMWATAATAALAGVALALASVDAPRLYSGLTGRGLPAVIVAFVSLGATAVALRLRHDRWARAAAILAMAGLVWGWGLAQFPRLVGPRVTVASSAAPSAELHAIAIALGAGAALLLPSLWLLHGAFRRAAAEVTR